MNICMREVVGKQLEIIINAISFLITEVESQDNSIQTAIQTLMSAMSPKTSHKTSLSYISWRRSVCTQKHAGPSLARSSGKAQHLAIATVSQYIRTSGFCLGCLKLLPTVPLFEGSSASCCVLISPQTRLIFCTNVH